MLTRCKKLNTYFELYQTYQHTSMSVFTLTVC